MFEEIREYTHDIHYEGARSQCYSDSSCRIGTAAPDGSWGHLCIVQVNATTLLYYSSLHDVNVNWWVFVVAQFVRPLISLEPLPSEFLKDGFIITLHHIAKYLVGQLKMRFEGQKSVLHIMLSDLCSQIRVSLTWYTPHCEARGIYVHAYDL